MRRRVRVLYDGREFTVPDADVAAVRRRIDAAVAGGEPWLDVVGGHGRGVAVSLRLGPGVPIALSEELQETAGEADEVSPEVDLLG